MSCFSGGPLFPCRIPSAVCSQSISSRAQLHLLCREQAAVRRYAEAERAATCDLSSRTMPQTGKQGTAPPASANMPQTVSGAVAFVSGLLKPHPARCCRLDSAELKASLSEALLSSTPASCHCQVTPRGPVPSARMSCRGISLPDAPSLGDGGCFGHKVWS